MKIISAILKWIMIILLVVLIGYFVVNILKESFKAIDVGEVFVKSAKDLWNWLKDLFHINK